MSTDRHDDAGSPLQAGLRLLRERWWLIAVCGLIGAALAFANAARQEPLYESTATVVLTEGGAESLLDDTPQASSSDPQRRAQTELALLQSDRIASQVVAALDLDADPGDVAAAVDVTLDAESDVLQVSVSDPDPERAAAIANQWAAQYELSREESRRAQYQQVIPTLERQIRQAATDGIRNSLRDRLRQVEQAAAYTQAGVDLYSRARPASAASSPTPQRDAIMGLLLGLGVGVALVLLLDALDRRVRRPEDFEEAYGMRALTTLAQRPRGAGFAAEDLEALRILRGNLAMLAPGEAVRVVLVTSAAAAEGKTSVAAGLANVAAAAGEDVLVIEGDLRRPGMAAALGGVSGRAGLSEVLAGAAFADHVDAPVPGLQRLHLLAAGSPPANPADLLRGPAFPELLREAAERYDLVVVDLPPLLPVADAQLLVDLPEVDACVLVARSGRSTRAEIGRARRILEGHRQTHVGLVVNGAARADVVAGYPPAGRGRRGRELPAPEPPVVVDASAGERS